VGLWRYRVGDYRVILDIQRAEVVIVAIDLGHRSEIYG
jgi:mRNA interferase RelE/StbE